MMPSASSELLPVGLEAERDGGGVHAGKPAFLKPDVKSS
jgi:hypothetical protein